ncbi:MAG: hypothetical protein L6R35_004360, partial [Caloplaca aegaea]
MKLLQNPTALRLHRKSFPPPPLPDPSTSTVFKPPKSIPPTKPLLQPTMPSKRAQPPSVSKASATSSANKPMQIFQSTYATLTAPENQS